MISAMIAMTEFQWLMIALMIAAYFIVCVRMTLRMARIGRSPWLWFFITFFLTGIPAMIVLFRHDVSASKARRAAAERQQTPAGGSGEGAGAPPAGRCPHCRRVIAAGADELEPVATCPHCNLPIEGTEIA